MTYELIEIDDLIVSDRNDRHGELPDEDAAIEWLLQHHSNHMRNLANDIAHKGIIYEPPIVIKEGSRYRVYDGNRRVTSIKLLNNPDRIPEHLNRKAWLADAALWRERKIKSIECRVETNIDLVNAILERRHAGSLNGVGQSTWDNPAKQNFLRRTGRISSLTTAEHIEALLRSHNQLPSDMKVLRSKLDRLFSASKFRTPFGFDIKKEKVVFLAEPELVLNALRRTVVDLNKKEITLADIWDETKKFEYISHCRERGLLPDASEEIQGESSQAENKESEEPKPEPKPKPKPTKLIPHSSASKTKWSENPSRVREVWEELQFHLTFDNHQNSISVMFRVLIELTIVDYSKFILNDAIYSDKALTDRLVLVARDLKSKGFLTEDQLKDLEPLIHNERTLSPKLLHKYVHSPYAFPSVDHLASMWKNLEALLTIAVSQIETVR